MNCLNDLDFSVWLMNEDSACWNIEFMRDSTWPTGGAKTSVTFHPVPPAYPRIARIDCGLDSTVSPPRNLTSSGPASPTQAQPGMAPGVPPACFGRLPTGLLTGLVPNTDWNLT